ncbi:hypothetical protein IFM89_012762 [Coptis chinensis]|uniref:SOSEKI DIX-like domain-containing protein n=1 Tax=Coptis chinensis TaxID=261450 RepID=A0A835HC63_9MAGN|nr:hypothetical protein IFM89_012762 [Coptis chinensis]
MASRVRTNKLQVSSSSTTSPERTMVWTEPNSKKLDRKVAVVYYLSREGNLEHPHFMEVPLSSNEGLYLKDVINRLNSLRGKGMTSMYSWSSKRSYKNGFVWHDLSENDYIYPVHGQEYVLKGSELMQAQDQQTIISSEKLPQIQRSSDEEECNFQVVTRRRNQSWSAVDLHEYKVYKAESSTGEYVGKAADASTQTEDKFRRRRRTIREEEEDEKISAFEDNHTTELNREEISPPPSSSSPETLETLIEADKQRSIIVSRGNEELDRTVNINTSGRMKASTVLMQLISCGSFSIKDYGSVSGKDHQGLSLVSQYKSRLPRGAPNHQVSVLENVNSFGGNGIGVVLEDKEYFSGSLIETKKNDFSALKRSSSYNADRSSKLDLKEKEIDGVRAKCIPRRPKISMKKESRNDPNDTPRTNA